MGETRIFDGDPFGNVKMSKKLAKKLDPYRQRLLESERRLLRILDELSPRV